MDVHELIALQLRAERVGLRPSVLARNMIRTGLTLPVNETLSAAVDRVDAAVEDLRALAP